LLVVEVKVLHGADIGVPRLWRHASAAGLRVRASLGLAEALCALLCPLTPIPLSARHLAGPGDLWRSRQCLLASRAGELSGRTTTGLQRPMYPGSNGFEGAG
jgi:hypothetical protein